MKTKTLYILLAAFAAVCAVLGAMPALLAEAFSGMLAFPFEQIGLGLRALSLSGGGGNIAAIVIYILISLLPIGFAMVSIHRRGWRNTHWLAIIFSLMLFGVLYLMINPGLLGNTPLGGEGIPAMKSALGGCCWSLVVASAVLALLRSSAEADRERNQRYLGIMLYVLAFFFVALAFGGGVSAFSADLTRLHEGNTMPGNDLSNTIIAIALRNIAAALPYALDALVAVKGAELMGAISADRYSDETLAKAEVLQRLCARCLMITVIVSVVVNILQLIFIERLYSVDVNVEIPLLSIGFVLLTMTLLGFMRENKALKDDNDLFI